MKKLLMIAAIVAGSMPLTATESSAIVCARGVFRAGCAGPNGAVATGPAGAAAVARPVAPVYRGPAAGVVVGPRGGAAVIRR
jgi:hypothetical protein